MSNVIPFPKKKPTPLSRAAHANVMTDELGMRETTGHARRRKCKHGRCTAKALYTGTAAGLAMTGGCYWHVRQWLRSTRQRQRGRS